MSVVILEFLFLLSFSTLPIMVIIWWLLGRDFVSTKNKARHISHKRVPLHIPENIPLHYEPIKELSPSELGVIYDEKVTNQDIVAEIFELARLEYLKITPLGKTTIDEVLIYDYQFDQLNKNDSSLEEHQKLILSKLFASDSQVKLSSLRGNFFDSIVAIKNKIIQVVDKKGYFVTSIKDKSLYQALAIGLQILSATSYYVATDNHWIILYVLVYILFYQFHRYFDPDINIFADATNIMAGVIALTLALFATWSYVGHLSILAQFYLFIVQPVILWQLANQIPQRSATGYLYYLQAKGLKQTLLSGAWREQKKEENLFIDEILPYAVALGITDNLVRNFGLVVSLIGDSAPTKFQKSFIETATAKPAKS